MITCNEYFSNYMFRPWSKDLSVGEACWVGISSAALLVLTVGITHTTCHCLYNKQYSVVDRKLVTMQHVAFLAQRVLLTPRHSELQNNFAAICKDTFEKIKGSRDASLLTSLEESLTAVSIFLGERGFFSKSAQKISKLQKEVSIFSQQINLNKVDIINNLLMASGNNLDITRHILDYLPRRDFDALAVASTDHRDICQRYDTSEGIFNEMIATKDLSMLTRYLGRPDARDHLLDSKEDTKLLFSTLLIIGEKDSKPQERTIGRYVHLPYAQQITLFFAFITWWRDSDFKEIYHTKNVYPLPLCPKLKSGPLQRDYPPEFETNFMFSTYHPDKYGYDDEYNKLSETQQMNLNRLRKPSIYSGLSK